MTPRVSAVIRLVPGTQFAHPKGFHSLEKLPAQWIILVDKDGLEQWLAVWQFSQRRNLSQGRMLVPKQLELQFLELCKPWQQRSIERHTNAQGQRVDKRPIIVSAPGNSGGLPDVTLPKRTSVSPL